jgi:hypothetical protein
VICLRSGGVEEWRWRRGEEKETGTKIRELLLNVSNYRS